MGQINLDSYFQSLQNYKGEIARESIVGIEERLGFEILKYEEIFYAKNFFSDAIPEVLYFFNNTRLRIVEIGGNKERINNVVNRENSYNQINNISLKLSLNYEVSLRFKIDENEFTFNNTVDSNNHWVDSLGKHIIKIHDLINLKR